MSCADSDEQRKQNTERYRSGHNEAVLKTVCPQGHMGSNPILSARRLSRLKIQFERILLLCQYHNFSGEKMI